MSSTASRHGNVSIANGDSLMENNCAPEPGQTAHEAADCRFGSARAIDQPVKTYRLGKMTLRIRNAV
jgi:hypothetical protein